ncbi:gag/pol protein [Cucumis melo var. makuwa]|uniref:Gag/pol protein n=1 Tax=Cucumis melo var. makuwa TaxID=1194695 RepID=A0A5A7VAH2_CUCMM|nr:gag/pol protein [Cucumis melo var. makuwa]TYK18604.1 gag/pol protein [Cucumis melo var. makuwa]
MDSLRKMFGKTSWSLRHEAIKYIYTKKMKEGTSVGEHVIDMIMQSNIAKVNGGPINKENQVSFILQSLPKSFVLFQMNVSLNKIKFTLTTLLNELYRLQNLTIGKEKKVEVNVASTEKEFIEGSSSKTKVGPSQMKKEKGKTPKNIKGKKVAKGKCYHCDQNGHWLGNFPEYLAEKKEKNEAQGKYDLLAIKTCLVEHDAST